MTKAHPKPEPEDDGPQTEFPPEDEQPAQPAEPLSAGQFDQQGKTWSDDYTAATDNPAHPLRHLKGVV